jgi:hypothetical protein
MSTLANALAFARHGHAVLPLWWPAGSNGKLVCACGRLCGNSAAKHPHSRLAPKGLHSATTDTGIVKNWFGYQLPAANLGVVTDKLVVLDVDPRNDGDDSLAALVRTYGDFPATWRALTGGGGEHIIFACPDGVEIASFAAGVDAPLGPGIDFRARGGYIVAPPSRHISGRDYVWNVDGHPAEVPLAVAPVWLAARLNRHTVADARIGEASTAEPVGSGVWAQLTRQPVSDYRDAAAAKIAGHLFRHGCDYQLIVGMMHAWNSGWCKPPLGYHELSRIVDRIANKEADRIERELAR